MKLPFMATLKVSTGILQHIYAFFYTTTLPYDLLTVYSQSNFRIFQT